MDELLVHPIFDEEFRSSFDEKIRAMEEQDELRFQELMKTELKTKDGRSELDEEELATEDEAKEEEHDDIDDDDDDSSSAVCTPGTSDEVSPEGSSSGMGGHHTNNVKPLYHNNNEATHDTPSTYHKQAKQGTGEGSQTDGVDY